MSGMQLLDRPEGPAAEERKRFEDAIDVLIDHAPEVLPEPPATDAAPRDFGWGHLVLLLGRRR